MPINDEITSLTDPTVALDPPPGGGSPPPPATTPSATEPPAQAAAAADATTARPVGVSAIRKRAIAAEARVEDLAKELRQTRQSLEDAQREINNQQRTAAIDAALIEADAIDLETTRLLAKAADDERDNKSDPRIIVTDLKRRKPFLFRSQPSSAASAMSATATDDSTASIQAAAEAAAGGDRNALMRFLRLRRQL